LDDDLLALEETQFWLLLLLLLLLPRQPPVCVGMGIGHGTKGSRFIESLGRP